MDAERALVAKAIHTGAIDSLVAQGISPDHFADKNAREVWEFAVAHNRKHRKPPSLAATRKWIDDKNRKEKEGFHYTVDIVEDALSYVTEEFIRAAKRRFAVEAMRDLSDSIDDDEKVEDIEGQFLEKARELAQLVPSARVQRFSEMSERIAKYEERKKEGITEIGIPTGIPDFDSLMMGVQPHEYVSIVGWQGTGKSTLLQFYFFQAYLAGYTPMLFSLEMEGEALYRKWDTMATNFEYRALKAMDLPGADKKKWEAWAERAAKAKNDIIVIDDINKCTVDKVYAETVRYKPDLVGVDYVSLMDAPRSAGSSMWERVTYLTRSLKQNARGLKIPVYAVAQTNAASAEGGADLANIAYSRSIGQDSDVVFGLFQDPEMKETAQMDVRLLKLRDGPTTTVNMHWDMSTMTFRPRTEKDLFKAAKDADAKTAKTDFKKKEKKEVIHGHKE